MIYATGRTITLKRNSADHVAAYTEDTRDGATDTAPTPPHGTSRPQTFRYRFASECVDVPAPEYVRRIARQTYRTERRYTSPDRARDAVASYLLWTSHTAHRDRLA